MDRAERSFVFWRGVERRAYPQRSVRSEQQSQKAKEPRPEGLPIFWPLSRHCGMLVGQRPLRVFFLLAPRQRPKNKGNATHGYFGQEVKADKTLSNPP
ncbi:MAG: hypothetical protein LV481_03565 [Methylacidiphilales bacterium]|nr:hypothetical protein [Candidatus Methylacidiphilales bacterium]